MTEEKRIKIKSNGTGYETQVLNLDGKEIPNIERIDVISIIPNDFVRANIHYTLVDVDVEAIIENETYRILKCNDKNLEGKIVTIVS